VVREEAIAVSLVPAKVVDVKPVGMGARVCVDTCDLLSEGGGLLVGSQASGLFLIQAEVEDTPHAAARPFRVNAGPVSSYILTPDGTTKYLSELSTGDKVLVVNRRGETKPAVVGRTKIEWRPMVLVVAEYEGSLAVSPDGQLVATGLDNGQIDLWQIPEMTLVHTWEGRGAAVTALAFSPAGTRLAAADKEGNIRLWDMAAKTVASDFTLPDGHSANALAFTPTGTRLAAGLTDGKIWVWEMQK
jgi:WD40 repeat protein